MTSARHDFLPPCRPPSAPAPALWRNKEGQAHSIPPSLPPSLHLPRTRIPQQHNRAGAAIPALADIRALRLLAHGMQIQLPQALPQFLKARMRPSRGRDVEPVRTTAFRHGTTDFGGDGLGLRGGHQEGAARVRALLLRGHRQEGGGGEGVGGGGEEEEENAEEEGWSWWEW